MERISREHPLSQLFADMVQDQLGRHVASHGHDDAAQYLSDLLLAFVRTEQLFAIRDPQGKPLKSIIEMVAEGDVRLNATSFDRERQVHKHIGDFILFWSGVYPDFLRRFKINEGEITCDYALQARESYRVVSLFDHAPYDAEAPVFEKLSQHFDDYRFVLRQVSQQANLYVA